MSLNLLKRSLEIAEESLPSKSKKANKNSRREEKSALDLIPENRKLLSTTRNKGKRAKYEEISRNHKRSVLDIKKEIEKNSNKVEENVKKLLKLSSTSLDSRTFDTILKRAKSGKYIVPEEKKSQNTESSVFTEEDFKSFEKEYFGSR